MRVEWDGITKPECCREDDIAIRHNLAEAAKRYHWALALEILADRPDLINATRLNGQSFYTPLHQAAYGNAPLDVVEQMIAIGAWRSLRTANGERALDIARRKQHQHLLDLLQPVDKKLVPPKTIQRVQSYFHAVIHERASHLVTKYSLRLPELEVLLELEQPEMWFPIPGMYGGFRFRLEDQGENTKLISESWCRVVGGSGERHEITSKGSTLTDKGFV